MFIMRRLLCAVLIAESWSKLYRGMRDFLVESIQPATSWFGRQWQWACGEHLLPHWTGANIDPAPRLLDARGSGDPSLSVDRL